MPSRGPRLIDEVDVQTLTQVGLTSNQAKLYIALLKAGRLSALNVSKHSKVPRQEVYRVLNELQDMGLVEKIIAIPNEFEAIPIDLGLQILISKKDDYVREIREKAKEILRETQSQPLKELKIQENKVVMIEGKHRLMQIIKSQHDNAKRSIKILSAYTRWLQILDFCFPNYCKALDRGVRYQVVIEKPEVNSIPENVGALLTKPNFELRLRDTLLETNSAIFDGKEATINFYPPKPLSEAPLLWTDHPSLIRMCEDHFEKLWKSAHPFERARVAE
jgi:sugar-specific transcriptional regulator TrmB